MSDDLGSTWIIPAPEAKTLMDFLMGKATNRWGYHGLTIEQYEEKDGTRLRIKVPNEPSPAYRANTLVWFDEDGAAYVVDKDLVLKPGPAIRLATRVAKIFGIK